MVAGQFMDQWSLAGPEQGAGQTRSGPIVTFDYVTFVRIPANYL